MAWRNTSEQWGDVAKLFHWLIAFLIFCMIALGFAAVNVPLNPTKLRLFAIHKVLGLCIFVLVLVRLAWRLHNPTPILPPTLAGWERALATATHWLLYTLMILMPVSGYVITSAANFPINVMGWFEIPLLVGPDKRLEHSAEGWHVFGFYVLAALLTLHIAAALRHHFTLKDNILRRMWPGI